MKTRRFLAVVLIMAFIIGYAVPATPADAAKAVKLSKKKVTITRLADEKVKIKLKNLPKKAKVTWVVSKGKELIKLSSKKRTSVKIGAKNYVGTAKVTAKIKLPKKKKTTKLTCTVKVIENDDYAETPEPTLPPHVTPEGEPRFEISNGVLTGGNFTDVYEITIPDGVKEIGKGAFAYCHTLEKITIPEGVEKIGEKAFNDCTRLQDVSFPSTMKEIGKDAFFECVSLKTVSLNDGLISIGAGSFFQCRSVNSVVIPSSVTELGDYAFAWCEKLESAEIKANLTEIPRELFDSCTNLKKVNIPATVKKIGDRAFFDCMASKGIVLPAGLDSVGFEAFENCPIGAQTIDVRSIGAKAFYATGMKSIKLSERVEEIGKDAFNSVGEPMKGSVLTIPASVKNIDTEAFHEALVSKFKVSKGNTILKAVDGVLFSANGETLISYPLKRIVEDYTLPQGVKEIASHAMESAPISGKVTFPEGLKKIDEEALIFTQLTGVSLPDGLESIGKKAFFCTNVKKLSLPDSVKDVGVEAFGSMAKLTSAKLSSGMEKIDIYLLRNCEKLKEVIVPDSIKEIDPDAFMGSKKLEGFKGIEFGEKSPFTVKDGFLYSDGGKKLVACDPVFDQFSDVEKSLTIQDGVEEIGDFAISSGVNYITIPDSVKKIGRFACGFEDRLEDGSDPDKYNQVQDFFIISKSKVAIDFAKKYHLNIISEKDPEYFYNNEVKIESESKNKDEIVKKITLKAGETFDMKVKGVETKAYYTSSDPKIAKVDQNGKITAVANGTTSIIEAVERLYFVLEVTVTDGKDPVYDDGLKRFIDDDEESVQAWEDLYFKFNPKLWFTKVDYPAINVYSGNSFNSVTAPYFGRNSGNYKTFITKDYGEGNGEYFNTLSENLEHELDEPKLNDDLLLFSGKKANYGVDYITKEAFLDSLIGSIGKTETYKNVISTSLYHKVANGFGAGSFSAIFEIEGRKDKVHGMFIRQFSQYPSETEFLLNHGTKFKVVDAGVKRFFTRLEVYDNETEDSVVKDVPEVKPYLRLQIV